MKHSISVSELADELLRRRLIESTSTPPEPNNERPWFISIVLGFSGWLAGIFALACIALFFKPDTPGAIALIGLILLSGAFGLYIADRSGAFFDQLALALSIAGQIALAWAASDATKSEAATAALVALMQVILLFVMPNALAKVLATFFACCAWAFTVRYTWWDRATFLSDSPPTPLVPALIGWFIVWMPVLAAVRALIKTERAWMASDLRRLARPALRGLLVSLAAATWISDPGLIMWSNADQARTNWLVLWPLLGVAGALFAAVCAFRLRSRAMIGLSAVGALMHVAQFYYQLGTTLLIKSSIMLAVGAAALVAAHWLNQQQSEA
jgi:hypothetical protein